MPPWAPIVLVLAVVAYAGRNRRTSDEYMDAWERQKGELTEKYKPHDDKRAKRLARKRGRK